MIGQKIVRETSNQDPVAHTYENKFSKNTIYTVNTKRESCTRKSRDVENYNRKNGIVPSLYLHTVIQYEALKFRSKISFLRNFVNRISFKSTHKLWMGMIFNLISCQAYNLIRCRDKSSFVRTHLSTVKMIFEALQSKITDSVN